MSLCKIRLKTRYLLLRLKSRFQNLKPHLPLSVPLTRKLKNKQVLKFRDLRLREFYLVAPPLRTKKTRTR